jgi:NAD(P)-dependent dehydrogenase (short-subunit alcohol dehydrogenase family)
MRRRLDYRQAVAVVTGASSGIGRAVALNLAERGTAVVGMARRFELLTEVIEGCQSHAPLSTALVVDVSDREAVEEAIAEVLERFGRLDILVNNAGMSMRVHASRLSVDQVERAMAVNFYGAVYATMAALPAMLERQRGDVVNVSSVAGKLPSPREAAYTASKHALTGWTHAMAADLVTSGVRFHVVHPGPIETDIWDKLGEPAAYRGRFYPPERVAAAVRACVDNGRLEAWVPGSMRVAALLASLVPGVFTKAAGWFDDRRVNHRP